MMSYDLNADRALMRKIYIDDKEYYMLADSLRTMDNADVPSLPVQVGENQGQKISDYIWTNPSTIEMSLIIYDNYRDEYISHLKNIYKNKSPVKVVTPWEVFPSAVLRELEIKAQKRAINVFLANVTFQEVRLSKVSVEKIKSPKPETEEWVEGTVEISLSDLVQLPPERPKLRWTQLQSPTVIDVDSPIYKKDLWTRLYNFFTGHTFDYLQFDDVLAAKWYMKEFTFTARKTLSPQQFTFTSRNQIFTISLQYKTVNIDYWINNYLLEYEDVLYNNAHIKVERGGIVLFNEMVDRGTTYKIKNENGYIIGLIERTGQLEFKIWLPP